MNRLDETGGIIDGILAVVHPELYRAGQEVMRCVHVADGGKTAIAGRWPTVCHAAQVIVNRETIFHRDTNGLPGWYDVLASVGSYGERAVFAMRTLGVSVPYDSGSMMAVCARVIMHAVPAVPPDRVCYAWLMRELVMDYYKVPKPGWCMLTERRNPV